MNYFIEATNAIEEIAKSKAYNVPVEIIEKAKYALNCLNEVKRIYDISTEEEENEEHTLIIKALHDAQATCSCGKWEYVYTGERTREKIAEEHHRHANR